MVTKSSLIFVPILFIQLASRATCEVRIDPVSSSYFLLPTRARINPGINPEIDPVLSSYLWPMKQTVIETIEEISSSLKNEMSHDCLSSLSRFSSGLTRNEIWSLQMLDSWGKMPSGFLTDQFVDMGHFHQCLEIDFKENQKDSRENQKDFEENQINSRENEKDFEENQINSKENEKDLRENQPGSSGHFVGQHAMIYMKWPLPDRSFKYESPYIEPTSIHLARNGSWLEPLAKYHTLFYLEPFVTSICYPSTCTKSDLKSVLNYFNNRSFLELSLKVSKNRNEDSLSHQSSAKFISQVILLSLIGVTFFATASNYIQDKKSSESDRKVSILSHFDAIANWSKVTNVPKDPSSRRLLFFHGIRFYYFLMAIMSHLLLPLSVVLAPIYFPLPFFYFKHKMMAAVSRISAAHLAMNFVMGGALSYYSWHEYLVRSNGRLSFFVYVIVRWLRTLPVIIACILIVISFPSSKSAGPFFDISLENMTANCISGWHKEVFGYGNLGKDAVNYMCMPHAWYLSADIQLYTGCFGLILLLFKRPKIGVSVSFLLILSSMVALIWYIGGPLKGFPGDLDFEVGRRLIYKNHFDPINHYGSYIIGLLLGYGMALDYGAQIPKRHLPYIYFVTLQLYTLTLIVPMFILALPDEVTPNEMPWIESTVPGALLVQFFRQRPNVIYWMKWINISVQRQNFSISFAAICFLLHASTKSDSSKSDSSKLDSSKSDRSKSDGVEEEKRESSKSGLKNDLLTVSDQPGPESAEAKSILKPSHPNPTNYPTDNPTDNPTTNPTNNPSTNPIEHFSNVMMSTVVGNLSNPYFVIFGRISYSVFMIHFFVIAHFMSSPTDNISFTLFQLLVRASYVFILSITLGVLLFLTVEAPLVGLLKSIAGKKSISDQSSAKKKVVENKCE